MPSEILQRIAEQSSAATASGAWSFLPPASSMRILPFADSATLEELREEFSEERLEAERVLVRGHDNRLVLNPVLSGTSSRGLFLRSGKDEPPFDIVNQTGALATTDPPAFACGRDDVTESLSRNTKAVLVVLSDDDLLVARMLGLPCTPAAGLASMTGEQVRRLFWYELASPGNGHRKPADAIPPEDHQLLLTGWKIAELKNELPGELTAVVECLHKAEEAFDFEASNRFGIWQPTEQDFHRMRSAVELQDRAQVRKLIWHSASRSISSPRQFEAENELNNPADYEAARRKLLLTLAQARELGMQPTQVARRLETFNRSFDQSVVDAIIRDAMVATDSVDRALLLAAAELMGHWHSSSALVRSTRDGASGRIPSLEETLNPDELKERLRVVDGLVKIHRELTRNR